MKKYFSPYLEKLEKQDERTRVLLLIAAFGLLLFLALAITLPLSGVLNQSFKKERSQAQAAPVNPAGPYTEVFWPGSGYTKREWEFTPFTDVYDGYFWSHQQGFANGDGFYVGMQTGNGGGHRKSVLFSIWNALGASSDGTNGASCSTFGGEGVGYHCSIAYNWTVGRTYRFRVAKVSSGWWGAWVTDKTTGTETFFGKIQVPLSWGDLSAWSIMWTEMFWSPPLQLCTDTSYAKGKFGNLVSDDTVQPRDYNSFISNNSCSSNTRITQVADGVLQEVGVAAAGHGLTGTYYNNVDFTGTSAIRVDANIRFDNWDNSYVPAGIDPDTFSVRWAGTISIPTTGTYTFYTDTDDGARLWVNNQQLVNNWVSQIGEKSGTISLAGGQSYPIVMEYYDAGGNQRAVLNWSGPGINKRSIPQYYLLPGNAPPPGTTPTPTPVPPVNGELYLGDQPWASAVNGWGPVERNKSNNEIAGGDGNTITLNGITYTKGLGAHAYSEIHYALDGNCSVFNADIGVDDEMESYGSIIFQVFADGTKLYDSGVMTGSTATKSITNLPISGKRDLSLIVTDAGDGNGQDHADWANARILCMSSIPTPTPTVISSTPTLTPTPTKKPTPTPTRTPTPTPLPKMTLVPTADTFVEQQTPDKNYGNTGNVRIDGNPKDTGLLKFDTAALVGKTVVSAKLRLYVTDASPVQVSLLGAGESWGENGVTWSTKPNIGSLITSIPPSPLNTYVEVDITSYITPRIGQKIAFALNTASTDSFWFATKETTNKPLLVITYR